MIEEINYEAEVEKVLFGLGFVREDFTRPTKEFSGTSPVGDKCLGVVLNCNYEEEVREARSNLRWFEASPGSILFHIVSMHYSAWFHSMHCRIKL